MKKRTLFFRLGAIAILLAIAAVMMVIGRGHTVYFDNKKLEVNGETYDTPYKVCVYVGDERHAALLVVELGYLLTIHIHHRLIGGLVGLAVIFQGLAVQIDRMPTANDGHGIADRHQQDHR